MTLDTKGRAYVTMETLSSHFYITLVHYYYSIKPGSSLINETYRETFDFRISFLRHYWIRAGRHCDLIEGLAPAMRKGNPFGNNGSQKIRIDTPDVTFAGIYAVHAVQSTTYAIKLFDHVEIVEYTAILKIVFHQTYREILP